MGLIIIIALGVLLALLIFNKPRGFAIAALLVLGVVIGGVMTASDAPPSATCSTFEKALGKACK